MPTIVLDNIPLDVYDRLQELASKGKRTLRDELLSLVQGALAGDGATPPRIPDFVPGDETSPLFDLPRSSQPTPVSALPGAQRLPDPLVLDSE